MVAIEHIGIAARDTVELKNWYLRIFGFEVVYDNKKEMPTYFLKVGNESMIEIYPSQNDMANSSMDKNYQGVRHISFSTDNIENEYLNLLEHNATIIEPLTDNKKGVKTIWFRDIEGNIIHFIERDNKLF